MRIKNFTLLTLALFMMSVVAFAQNSKSTDRVLTPKQQLLQAKRTGQLTKENASAFKFQKPALPQNMQKAKANKQVLPVTLKAPAKAAKKQNVFTSNLKGKAKTPRRTDAQVYTYGFSQAMNGWTEIDADGDGYTWDLSTQAGHDGEAGLVASASYDNSVGALTPDNYLVSPKMKLDGKISFYASAQDAAWCAEHFAVMVSTASGTSAADFEKVQEWTMTAAPSLAPSANFNAPDGAFRSPRRAQGAWYLYEVDLSGYAGAEGYVAIRHFDCTDFYRLNVDDITLETSQLIDAYDPLLEIAPEKVELPDGAEVTPYYTLEGILAVYTENGWADYTKKVKNINVAFVGTDAYIQGLAYWAQDGWVKGTVSGNKITVPSGQFVGGGEYLNALDPETGDVLESYSFTIDSEAGTIASDDYIAESSSATKNILYAYWMTPVFTLTAPADPRVIPPTGLVTEDWTVARYFYDGEDETGEEKVIQIGFDGKDVYVQGFSYYSDYMEEPNWIKGTLSEDGKSITFDSGQYYGNYGETYDFYFAALDMNTFELASTITVEYDAEAGTMTWPEDMMVAERDEDGMYGYFTEITAMVKGTAPDPLAAPDVITTEWYFKSQSLGTDQETGETVAEDYNLHVQVAVVGTDVFVKGLCEDIPDAWIKGTLDPATNKVTFPTGQYFGQDGVLWFVFDYFFAGYGANGFEDVVMNYDATAKTLTMESPTFLLINAYWLLVDPNLVLKDVTLQEIQDVAATPAQPEIVASKLTGTSYPNITVEVPDTDTEGNPLLVDKLSYQYWYEVDGTQSLLTLDPAEYTELTEPMTEIPYSFSDDWDIYPYRLYLNQDFSDWKKIGIQSIYRGGGQEKKSEVSWKTISNISVDPNFDSTHGGISVTTKALEGETVSVTVKSLDTYVIVKVTARAGNTDLQVTDDGDGAYSFVAPAADVVVNAEFQAPPADFELAVEPGNISDALDAQITEDVTVRNVTLTLSEGNYTITKPIEAAGNVTITGAGENTVINASALDGPFIQLGEKPILDFITKADGTKSDYYGVDNVTIKNVKVTGLKNSIFWDSNVKYCVKNFTIDNSIFELATEATKNQAFISFQAGGAKDFKMQNSTAYQTGNEENNYFLRYNNSARLDRYGFDKNTETQSISYIKNTFYKVGKKGQWGNYNGIAGQKYSEFHVTNNIWFDCGNGQIARRILGGRDASSYNICEFNNNTYFFNGAAETGNTQYDGGTQLTTDPGFKDAANGDFHIGDVSYSDQAKYRTGDPRWLSVYQPEGVTAPIELIPQDGADLAADLEDAYKEQGLAPAYITINLLPGAHYTVSQPMEINATINIIGDEANPATIDLNDCSGPMVQYSSTIAPAFTVNNYGFYEEPFNVIFKNVIFARAKNQLFYANKQKYLVEYFTFENCIAEYLGGSKTIFDFSGGGVVDNFTINNSTIYGNSNDGMKHTGALYSSQSGDKATAAGLTEQKFNITNSTLYNIANGKNVMNHRQTGQTWLTFTVKNNVVFNCGKKGQFCQGLNGGQDSENPMFYVHYNSFMWYADGVLADIDDTCGSKNPNVVTASWKNTYPESAITDVFPKFFHKDEIGQYIDSFRGNFTVAEGSVQKTNSVGDPRWLKSNNEYTDIQGVNVEKTAEGAWYTIQGVRVDQPTKGLYIHNGKKVVIK